MPLPWVQRQGCFLLSLGIIGGFYHLRCNGSPRFKRWSRQSMWEPKREKQPGSSRLLAASGVCRRSGCISLDARHKRKFLKNKSTNNQQLAALRTCQQLVPPFHL